MKKIALLLTMSILLIAGCNKQKEFKTNTFEGDSCWLQIFNEPFVDEQDTIGAVLTYSVEWPEKGLLSPSAERELMFLCFGDSSSADMHSAAQKWLTNMFCYEDETSEAKPVESIPEGMPSSYLELESTCTLDDNLAVFCVSNDIEPYLAAHGLHTVDYLTVDMATGEAIHLSDLVTDTNLLCEAIARAIQDLDVNSDVREALFEEYANVNRMPLPHNFIIDSARNSISVLYGLYEIASYAFGIQEVVLPIFWLSKHVPLTPYAKRIFGPGCSVE